jgi:hypothetical protein
MVQQQGGGASHPEPVDMVPVPAEPPAPDPTRGPEPGPAPDEAWRRPPDPAQDAAPAPGPTPDGASAQTPDAARDAGPAPGPTTGAAPGAAASRARTRRLVLLGLAAVAVAVAVAFGIVGIRILQQKDAVLTAPDRAAGLTRDDSAQAAETADYLRVALAAEVNLDETLGVVYSDPANATRSVLFFGGTALLFSPDAELDKAFDLLTDRAGRVSNLGERPTGDLGGVMKCGSLAAEGEMAVCAWADHGSIGVAMFPGRSADDSAPLMRDLRAAIQTRD